MTQEVHLRDLRGQAGCSLDLPFCLSSSGMANICSKMSRASSRPSRSPVWKSRVRGVLLPHDTEAPSPAGELLHTEQGRGGTRSSRGGGPEGGCAPGDGDGDGTRWPSARRGRRGRVRTRQRQGLGQALPPLLPGPPEAGRAAVRPRQAPDVGPPRTALTPNSGVCPRCGR